MADDIQYEGKGKLLLVELAEALGEPGNLRKAARILNSVLYGVTNMLDFQASIAFLRAIPLYAKGIHQWGWQVGPNQAEKAQSIAELKRELPKINQDQAEKDFPTDESTDHAVQAVFMVLNQHMNPQRLEEARKHLPYELSEILTSGTAFRS